MATGTASWRNEAPPDEEYVRMRWEQLVQPYADSSRAAAGCLAEIMQAYGHKSRHYHNLRHVASLLKLSDQYGSLLQDSTVVDFAIFYHDIIYKVPGSGNEHKSAVLAAKRLQYMAVPAAVAEQVRLFIEATATHDVVTVQHPGDLAYFLDFDMSVLGAPWNDYEAYLKGVRKEYKWYPGMVYKPGRRKFLATTLAKQHIFFTDAFQQMFEAPARANMQRELSGGLSQ